MDAEVYGEDAFCGGKNNRVFLEDKREIERNFVRTSGFVQAGVCGWALCSFVVKTERVLLDPRPVGKQRGLSVLDDRRTHTVESFVV